MRHTDKFEDWLRTVSGAEWTIFHKRLSANETGTTGGHQRALVIPRGIGRRCFPDLETAAANPSRPLPFRLASHGLAFPTARVVHWNQGTRNEYHVTNFGQHGSSIISASATGRVLLLAFGADDQEASAWLSRSADEDAEITRRVGAMGSAGVVRASATPARAESRKASPARGSGAEQALPALAAVGGETTPPDPAGTAEAFSQSGYRFEHAIADLIDNSLDADARTVLVRFITDDSRVVSIVVADDGTGMSEERLREAMRYGGRFERRDTDLGKYGVGMKSASLSQCRSLSVISRQGSRVAGRRWTEQSIRHGWTCEILDQRAVGGFADRDWGPVKLRPHGTLIRWDGLDRLRTERDGIEASLATLFKLLRNHLGLVFHRFLARGRIRIVLDRVDASTWDAGLASEVAPLDPFGYPATGSEPFPVSFPVTLGDGVEVALVACVWPPNATSAGYRLGGGQVASRQGFYFYRNDRLIQAGGWNGWRDSDNEPHLSLARASIDLPITADRLFGLSLHKSVIDVPPDFLAALDRSKAQGMALKDWVRIADQVYRDAAAVAGDRVPIPILGAGLPPRLRRTARRILAGSERNVRPIRFRWARLPPAAAFAIDRDEGTILLNSRYRAALAGSGTGDAGDEAVTKTLLFIALRQQLARERNSKASVEELLTVNAMLLAAILERK